MAAEFKLQIDLGNDAMQSPDDIACALERVAERLRNNVRHGHIRDANGNTVGAFTIVPGQGLIG